ncbi:hypothetical protein DBV39_14500 [Orrella marina]|uniref:Uncharacterized protein n=1 Tax=Orrella marina TaxID=2163011 RepID=A0A2R4XLQ7_9BURK|nr:hypothetical protein DBV39_14500 [Orrella marina]
MLGRTESSDQLVVVTTPLPATADKEDRAILQQFEQRQVSGKFLLISMTTICKKAPRFAV